MLGLPCSAVLYFAYGSNLCASRLASRVPQASFVDIGRLVDHELRFHKRGRDGTAKADAHALPGSVMWGALAELGPAGIDLLDPFEPGYDRHELVVDTGGGETRAWVYRARTSVIQPMLAPRTWYLNHVVEGGRARGLPDEYLANVAQTAAVGAAEPPVSDC